MTPSPAPSGHEVRILVTGSRNWPYPELIHATLQAVLQELGNPTSAALVSGGARGVDAIAEEYWTSRGLPVERHIPDWDTYGKAAGPIRNNHMVSLGADLCVAFIHADSRGATQCADVAERHGIPTRRITTP